MTALRHKLADRGHDVYETPPIAIEALLGAETLPAVIWEPACGPGSIVRVLRDRGHVVYATDLVSYGSPDQDEAGWDFLLEKQLPVGVEAIVTNPPFKLAGEFVAHALELCPRVYMLLRLAFYESDRRSPILDTGKLAKVYAFRKRLPMMHRRDWDGPRATSTTCYAWFCWDADHAGPTELHRI